MEDFGKMLKGETPVLLDFYADWCGPCHTMNPIVEDIEKLYDNKIKVVKINVDEEKEITAKYKIRSVPTFILFKSGEIEWKTAGMHSRADFKREIDRIL